MKKFSENWEKLEFDNHVVLSSRLDNTKNGSPRYKVIIFKNGLIPDYMNTYSIVSYSLESDLKILIEEL